MRKVGKVRQKIAVGTRLSTRRTQAARGSRLVGIGAYAPHELKLAKRKIRIGIAADNDFVIAEKTVSRHHALLKRRFKSYRLIDLESTNGTFVNGRRVRGPTRLRRGDEVRFGSSVFVYLESPKTGELGKRLSLRTALVLALILFVSAFAVTQHLISLSLYRKLIAANNSESATAANLQRARDVANAAVEKERAEENQPLWLRRVNYYRRLANLPAVTEGSLLDHAAFLHSRYLVKYKLRTGALSFAHTEDPNAPYYTPEGLRAAERSDIVGPASGPGAMQVSGAQAVDGWMYTPFHRLGILNPALGHVGYGSYTEAGFQAADLYMQSPPIQPHLFSAPVKFPPPDSAVPLAVYETGEWPDPLTSCPGYVAPTGLPITLQVGAWLPVQVTSYSLIHDGVALECCVFTAETYANPDRATQSWARKGLQANGAVVLIPRAPLTSGERYTASISVAGQAYAWTFSVRQ